MSTRDEGEAETNKPRSKRAMACVWTYGTTKIVSGTKTPRANGQSVAHIRLQDTPASSRPEACHTLRAPAAQAATTGMPSSNASAQRRCRHMIAYGIAAATTIPSEIAASGADRRIRGALSAPAVHATTAKASAPPATRNTPTIFIRIESPAHAPAATSHRLPPRSTNRNSAAMQASAKIKLNHEGIAAT